MTDDSVQASTPAAEPTQPADNSPAQETYHHEMPAHETPADYDEQFQDEPADEPADLGEILEDRPKKRSGSERAKRKVQYLEAEVRQERDLRQQHEQRIAELERYIQDEDDRRRSSESERQAEAQRKREDAHRERVKGAKSAIPDFDRVMASMRGKTIHEDLVSDVLASEKSALLAYHLASNPDQLEKLNRMSERERVREIGRLEGTLKMPAGKKLTTAPPPPATLRGGAAPHRALEQVDDMKEFSKRLLEDLASRRR